MTKSKLHLDEDASWDALYNALTSNGHDVTRTPNEGIIVSKRKSLSVILKTLVCFFNESSAEEMDNQVRWLSDWEKEEQ